MRGFLVAPLFAAQSMAALSAFLSMSTVGNSNAAIFDKSADSNAPANSVPIQNFVFDDSQTVSGTGSGAGRITLGPVKIARNMDSASPKLFQYMASGQTFTATITVINSGNGAGGPTVKPVVYNLASVMISELSHDFSDSGIVENLSLNFGAKQIVFTSQRPDGGAGSTSIGSWDSKLNRVCSGAC